MSLRSISGTGDVSNGGHSLPQRFIIKLFNINEAAAFCSDASRLETAHIILTQERKMFKHLFVTVRVVVHPQDGSILHVFCSESFYNTVYL